MLDVDGDERVTLREFEKTIKECAESGRDAVGTSKM
jgi:hypothetical protein